MPTQMFLHALALVAVFAAGAALTGRSAPAVAQPAAAQPPAGHGKCISISAVQPTGNFITLYRLFEDGTIEKMIDAEPAKGKVWLPVK